MGRSEDNASRIASTSCDHKVRNNDPLADRDISGSRQPNCFWEMVIASAGPFQDASYYQKEKEKDKDKDTEKEEEKEKQEKEEKSRKEKEKEKENEKEKEKEKEKEGDRCQGAASDAVSYCQML